ncbi:hypothetical protein FS749_012160, partial [Ceratobasidium sp. UAMH 11750]
MYHRGYRGRGHSQPHYNNPRSSKLLEGLSAQDLCSIPVPVTDRTEGGKVEIANVVSLGSYNWVEHSVPTIIVP